MLMFDLQISSLLLALAKKCREKSTICLILKWLIDGIKTKRRALRHAIHIHCKILIVLHSRVPHQYAAQLQAVFLQFFQMQMQAQLYTVST